MSSILFFGLLFYPLLKHLYFLSSESWVLFIWLLEIVFFSLLLGNFLFSSGSWLLFNCLQEIILFSFLFWKIFFLLEVGFYSSVFWKLPSLLSYSASFFFSFLLEAGFFSFAFWKLSSFRSYSGRFFFSSGSWVLFICLLEIVFISFIFWKFFFVLFFWKMCSSHLSSGNCLLFFIILGFFPFLLEDVFLSSGRCFNFFLVLVVLWFSSSGYSFPFSLLKAFFSFYWNFFSFILYAGYSLSSSGSWVHFFLL